MNDERRFIILCGTVTFETDSSSAMKMEINKSAIDTLDTLKLAVDVAVDAAQPYQSIVN